MTNSVQVHGIVFQPMTKRFMVWDKGLDKFLEHAGEKVYDLPLLTDLLDTYNVVEIYEDLVIVQSTNLFDKDGKEIFEGSIVINDYLSYPDHKKGKTIQAAPKVVTWDPKTARFVLNANPIMDLASRGGNNGKNLTVIGHILSNPELLEEK